MVDLETYLGILLIFDNSSEYYNHFFKIALFWTCFGPEINWLPLGIRFENFFDDLFFCKNGENITMCIVYTVSMPRIF